MRYGLLDYLVWVVFLGSAIAALLVSERWQFFAGLNSNGERVYESYFSPDGTLILTVDKPGVVRMTSFPELKLLWEKKYYVVSDAGFHRNAPYAMLDGDGPYAKDVSLDAPGGNAQTHFFSLKDGSEPAAGAVVGPVEWYFSRKTPDGSYRLLTGAKGCWIERASYPAGYIGQLYRPEVWATLLAGVFLLYRIIRIRMAKLTLKADSK